MELNNFYVKDVPTSYLLKGFFDYFFLCSVEKNAEVDMFSYKSFSSELLDIFWEVDINLYKGTGKEINKLY